MKPNALRYVRDMEAARRFYGVLGLHEDFASRPPRHGPSMWVELGGGGTLALHRVPADSSTPAVELCLEAEEPLEAVVDRLRDNGYETETAIVDEGFGRSFTVRDPEGLLVQVNEHDRDLQR